MAVHSSDTRHVIAGREHGIRVNSISPGVIETTRREE